jgi:hypothetical protein
MKLFGNAGGTSLVESSADLLSRILQASGSQADLHPADSHSLDNPASEYPEVIDFVAR